MHEHRGGPPDNARIHAEDFVASFGCSAAVDANAQPLLLYHGTRAGSTFLDFRVTDQGIHFGTLDQAVMRNPGRIIAAYIRAIRPRRLRDHPHGWRSAVRDAIAAGFDSIIYLNRSEGVPLDRFDRLRAVGITGEQLDTMADSEFRSLVPEAGDSWIVFRPEQVLLPFDAGVPAPTRASRRSTPSV